MKLTIEQSWKGYKLFKNEDEYPEYTAKWKGGWFKKSICQIADNNDKLTATVEVGISQWFWSKKESTFIINLIPTSEQVTIRIISVRKGFWKFEYQMNNYEFHSHKAHKKSLYKEEELIAQFDKRKINLGYSDKATVVSNSNENSVILLSLFLIYDFNDGRDAELTIDLGRVTNGEKQFDESWRSKNMHNKG